MDFIDDVTEEQINADRLLWIVALHKGVIVSPKLIREFRVLYKNDLNRLIRDATRDQKVNELEGEECG